MKPFPVVRSMLTHDNPRHFYGTVLLQPLDSNE